MNDNHPTTYSFDYYPNAWSLTHRYSRTVTAEKLAKIMGDGTLSHRSQRLRQSIMESVAVGDSCRVDAADAMPTVCFSRDAGAYTGLVLLSFPVGDASSRLNLLARRAQLLAQTLMTFIGASGRSLKVVVATRPTAGPLPTDDAEICRYADNAFLRTALYYGDVLGVKADIRESGSEMACRVGQCEQTWINDHCMPQPIDDAPHVSLPPQRTKPETPPQPLSTLDEVEVQMAKFNFIYIGQTYQKLTDEKTLLYALAEDCRKGGVDAEIAVSSVLNMAAYRNKDTLVRSTFEAVYSEHPLGSNEVIDSSLVNQLRFFNFLKSRYRFRRNRVSGAVECREVNLYLIAWKPLDNKMLNTITLEAIRSGIKVWDKDVRRYINSTMVSDYDPIVDYVNALPQWDGRDRLKEMADRVKTNDPDWTENFKIWMRSMVSQWTAGHRLYGASMVLMLAGAQGTGKSTFIRLILPPELHAYYLDRLDFTTRKEAERALTRFALINMDEFDQISKSQTAYLKHLLQKSDITQRKLYEDTYAQSKRYAAFAATTNSLQPLTDPTGSRRYLVEEVTEPIDVNTAGDRAIDYSQLYAQVAEEIRKGRQCFFDGEAERRVQKHNKPYTVVDPVVEAFNIMYAKPDAVSEKIVALSPLELVQTLHVRFRMVQPTRVSAIRLGAYLKLHGFKRIHLHNRYAYEVVPVKASEQTR